MKAAPKLKAIRRTPTKEDIKMWQQNPHDERLPVPPSVVHGFTPGYRKAGGLVDGKPTANLVDFMKKFNTAHGESFYSHFADGEKSPSAHVGMTAAEATALVKAYERKAKEMPGMYGEETGEGFFKSIWHKLPERAKAAARLALRRGAMAFGRDPDEHLE